MEAVDVAVVGGGPVGLMLACELRLAGVDVVVLERLAGPSGESRAGGLHARTMEVLDQRGMLEPFLAAGRPLRGAHFSGVPLAIDAFPTRYPYLLVLLQRVAERLLEEQALARGARIRREVEVVGLAQDGSGVDLETTSGPVRARYVVGCDGGRSVVRKLAGIGFSGTDATLTAILGDVELTRPPEGEMVFQVRGNGGNYSVLGFEPGWYRVTTNEFDHVADREAPVTVEELRESLLRVAGDDFGLHSPRWVSRYSDAARQADTYRAGRVLLAGDAAHIHFPAGGQGLNTGVQDAVNLGWKLGAVLRGESDAHLLDTYQAERHPVAARVLENTRAQTALTRPGPHTDALRAFVADAIRHPAANEPLGLMITALDVRYDLGDSHPLVGLRVPDADLLDVDHGVSDVDSVADVDQRPSDVDRLTGVDQQPFDVDSVINGDHPTDVDQLSDVERVSLYRLLHGGRPVLLDLTDDPRLRARAAGWADRVDIVTARPAETEWRTPLVTPAGSVVAAVAAPAALLIRPDGHVAWATAEANGSGLEKALSTWSGPISRPAEGAVRLNRNSQTK